MHLILWKKYIFNLGNSYSKAHGPLASPTSLQTAHKTIKALTFKKSIVISIFFQMCMSAILQPAITFTSPRSKVHTALC
jgi:hypothetical protein